MSIQTQAHHDGDQQWIETVPSGCICHCTACDIHLPTKSYVVAVNFGRSHAVAVHGCSIAEANTLWEYGMGLDAEARKPKPPMRVIVGPESKGEQVPGEYMLRFTCADGTQVDVAYGLLERWVAVMPGRASDQQLREECARRGIGLRPGAADYGDQPTVGKAVERIAHWLDKRAEGLPDAIHEACDAIDDTLLDQHRDSTTIRAPKLRADIRGFIVAAYEEGKRRGWRSNITEATDDRVRDEANRRGVIAVRATLDEIREHGGTLKAVYADATRSATPPEKALGSMPLGGAAQALLKFGMESGPGIAALPKPDDSHYLLDVDLLADDE